MATRDDAVWTELDVEQFNSKQSAAYDELKAANEIAKAARKAFEQAILEDVQLAHGTEMLFGYRWGKCSVAIVKATAKPKATPKQSLSDWLKTQQR